MKRAPLVAALAAVGATGLGGFVAFGNQPEQPRGSSPDLGQMLIDGLRGTPGCLGVDAGSFMSGKNAIVAWFEDKDAVIAWYDSTTHRGAMRTALGDAVDSMEHTPLAHVDHDGPIMVIASITFTDKPELEGVSLPISQISIELYAPLPGRAYVNERLAPEEFKVDHMKNLTEYAPD